MSQRVGLIGHPVGHSISPLFQQALLDETRHLESLIRGQTGDLYRMRQSLAREGVNTVPNIDRDGCGDRFPEYEIANLMVSLRLGQQIVDQRQEFIAPNIILATPQSGAHFVGNIIGRLVIETVLNEMMHKHSAHEGNALLAVDDICHRKNRDARGTRIYFKITPTCWDQGVLITPHPVERPDQTVLEGRGRRIAEGIACRCDVGQRCTHIPRA